MVTRRDALIHGGLFIACCITTTIASGPVFAATLMSILTCHEFGHYIAGRRRGVAVSLPYFIPLPPVGTIGTLGAVIRMGDGVEDRNRLFDVGASGPIAGMLAAIPLLVIGLTLSHVGPLESHDMIEGNSILYALLKLAVFHRWLPSGGMDVQLHPMASAAWVGLLVTMINLIPIGQLDGGHIARAALGDAHEKLSARLHYVLPLIGLTVGGVMFAMARVADRSVLGALSYAKYGAVPWVIWAVLIGWMRHRSGEYHPPVGDVPLDPARRRAAIAMLILFVSIATPVPFRPVL